ncbi:MAG: ParB/RepB/Spo0J family partition protein [Firmicutes bacterium]|nr:ParB/RepB/Spo0J family partition protein [Bacillota bacterium]
MARQALGRGLRALIPDAPADTPGSVREIEVERVSPGPYQARFQLKEDGIEELAASIREHGVLEPVIVRPRGQEYELVAGERRWRAARLAGLRRIPALVRDLDDRQMSEIGLVENLQREDLDAVEEARAYQRLAEEFGLTQDEIARAVGKKRSTVANSLRLLTLGDRILELVRAGVLSAGHAKVLVGVEGEQLRAGIAEAVLEGGLSVRATEELVRERARTAGRGRADRPSGKERARERTTPALAEIAVRFERLLGTRVRIKGRAGKGRIEIEYYSATDLDRLYEVITKGGAAGRGT